MNNCIMAGLFLLGSMGCGYMFAETQILSLFISQITLFIVSVMFLQKGLDKL